MKRRTNDDVAYRSHGVRQCDLCEKMRFCTEGDELVACRTCQRELLPSSWPF